MAEPYEKIVSYLTFLRDTHGLQICIKDFCGFIPINKALDEALQPFLAHTNPFCMYLKSDPEHYHICLSMIRLMYNKLTDTRATFFGICHAGLGEYVIPIFCDGMPLGCINAGFFPIAPGRAAHRIARTCKKAPALDADHALALYRQCISAPTIDVQTMLCGLELLAEYLSLTYQTFLRTHGLSHQSIRYHISSEDSILSHALEYIRQNASNPIGMEELATFCHCSVSYLSRIFKRRTGINVNMYMNKVRIELAKDNLRRSSQSIAQVAAAVGFNDPSYFSRVFTQIMGIPPTEYRRRFHNDTGE